MSSSRTKTTSVCAGVCAGRAKTASVASRANASSAVVSVRVHTRVNNVSDTAVRSVSAGGVVVARYWVAAGWAGVASAAEARCASVSAMSAGVCAGVSAGGANTSGVARGADTGCAVSASRASGWAV